VQDQALAERKRLRSAMGRASTILTSGAGDLTPAPTAAKTLLGM